MSDQIINTHDQLVRAANTGLPSVAVMPAMSYGSGAESHQNGWYVYVPGIATDPKSHWADYGRKWFSIMGANGDGRAERKRNALLAAQTWASEHYGPVEKLARNQMRDYVDARVNKLFPLRDDR